MASNLNVTELDFDQIKQNLKNYLKTQSEFNDYNFEGSGLSTLLDVLSYNTHYNAMAAHFALNEAFLDSAQIRGNVVTRAKLLGYVPRSILAARAKVNIVIDVTSEVGTLPDNLTMNRGTKLATSVAQQSYQYVTLSTQTASLVTSGGTSTYTFANVDVAQGYYKSLKYRVDNDIENQKFQLSDSDADTSTLRVRVQENEESTAFDIYTRFETLLGVTATSNVYYLQENAGNYYEIYFGDGVTGRKPTNNNIITLDYVYTTGDESNGANVFTMSDSVGGFGSSTVTTVTAAAGGAPQETSESIRFNAPLTFTSQNRAVTSDDYRAIIQREFTNISSISCWGGEDNDPPDYGKAYISIKPILAETLTQAEKDDITGTILKGKNVVSITPEIVDLTSTPFKLSYSSTVDHYFGDIPLTNSVNRQVIVYKIVDGTNVTVINDAGLLDPDKGTITLNSFTTYSADNIRITVTPDSLDLAPKRNQLIAIDPLRVNITPAVDTIAVSGSTGTINYTTPSRLR